MYSLTKKFDEPVRRRSTRLTNNIYSSDRSLHRNRSNEPIQPRRERNKSLPRVTPSAPPFPTTKILAATNLNGTYSSPSSTQMKTTTSSVIKTNSSSLLPKNLATNILNGTSILPSLTQNNNS